MVNVYPSLAYIKTKIIPITDPDYGPNPDYGSGGRIADRDNFGHDRLRFHIFSWKIFHATTIDL